MLILFKMNLSYSLKIVFLLICLRLTIEALAQNYVTNPSFENYSSCPSSVAQINRVLDWSTPTAGSPDYFNACATSTFCDVPNNFFGSQAARTGDAYAQVVIYPSSVPLREYLLNRLTTPLIAGQTYDVSFYTCLQDNSYVASNNIGIYISATAPSSASMGPLPLTPQINETVVINDAINWTLISGTYTASGGEEYITIGNFYDDASTTTAINPSGSGIYATFYLIEDVCVTPQGGTGCNSVLPIELLNFYGEHKGDYNQLYWTTSTEINNDFFTIEKSNDAQSFEPIGTVNGAGNSSAEISYKFEDKELFNTVNYYRLKQTDFNGEYSYSKLIVIKGKEQKINIFPNPVIDILSIENQGDEDFKIELYNGSGEKILDNNIKGSKAKKLNLKRFSAGIYHLKLHNESSIKYKKIIKTN